MDILVISKKDNKNNWIDSKDIDNNINVNFYFIESFDDLNKIKTIDLMKFDAFFIDITEMEEKTFDKIKQYYFDNKEPPFAFYGGYHCTIDIYDIPHIYFCHNIRENNKINKILNRVKRYNSEKVFWFTNNRKTYRMNYSEIKYIESDKRICHLYDKDDKKYDFYKKLDEVCFELGNGFLRCSKSFLINRDFIESSNSDKVTLKDGKEFTITRNYTSNKKIQII